MKKTLRKLRDYIRSINPHILSSYDRFFIPGAGIPHSRKCLEHNIENMKNEKVVVFISSRNNYDMMANELLVNADYGDFLVFNVDDGSVPSYRLTGPGAYHRQMSCRPEVLAWIVEALERWRKGLALDRMVPVLEAHGIAKALLSGGDSSLMAMGAPPGEQFWKIGIYNPYNTQENIEIVHLRDEALSTSACYQHLSGVTGQPCGIFDPRTGMPVDDMMSATVVAPTASPGITGLKSLPSLPSRSLSILIRCLKITKNLLS